MRGFHFRAQPLLELASRRLHQSNRAALEAGTRVDQARSKIADVERMRMARLSACHLSFTILWNLETEAIGSGRDYSGLLSEHRSLAQRAVMALNAADSELADAKESCRDLQAAARNALDERRAAQESKKRFEKLERRDREVFCRNTERVQAAELNEVGAVMLYLARLEAEESGFPGVREFL